MEKANTAWGVQRDKIERGYGHLPKEAMYAWATHQADLSERYQAGDEYKTSATQKGKKRLQVMVNRVSEALIERSILDEAVILRRIGEVEEHLEDPGLLENFEFFDIPSSDFMLQFYFAVWDGRIAEVMEYLHNHGKDLAGNICYAKEDDIWSQMSYFEGMNISQRIESQNLVDFIRQHDIKLATSFGGGNIPERLYSLPEDLRLTVFDHGRVSPLTELFPDERMRYNVKYYREPFSKAPTHHQLYDSQQLVWMHGVSMYLDEVKRREMTSAVLCGALLLEPGGYMRYNYLIWTESMRRVVKTQNWPNPISTFHSLDEAIAQGRETLEAVNRSLEGKAYLDVVGFEPTLVEPWGVTGVQFTVQKYT